MVKYELLNKPKEILQNFYNEVLRNKSFWENMQTANPHFEQLSDKHWDAQNSRYWIFGSTSFTELNALDKRIYSSPPNSDIAKTKASHCLKHWKIWLKQDNAYYSDCKDFKLPATKKNEILYDYLQRLATKANESKNKRPLEWRALKSFLGYLRNLVQEEIAFIEHIFPEEMDIRHDSIIRLIRPEVYPFPQERIRDILFQQVQLALNGRPNAQFSALESLGLSWLCLNASHLRLPTHLEMVAKTKITSIITESQTATLLVPTLFGNMPLKISSIHAQFFISLATIPSEKPRDTILQSSTRTLTRTLDRALNKCGLSEGLGNITYVTFLSEPHSFGNDHRFIPN